MTEDIKRDRWGRPLIQPVDGGKPVAYTRVSTLAKTLDNKEQLMRWKCRQTAMGLGKRNDLVAMAAAVGDDKGKLDEIVAEAMSAAASNAAANLGTTLHALTEHVDNGTKPDYLPGELIGDLTAYEEAMRGITVLGSEKFIVNDEVQAAGTFDRLLALPGIGMVVADIKTGQHEPNYPHAACIQVATYARGHLYDHDKGRIKYLPDLGVSTDVGLMIWLPAGKARCELYLLDLNLGWELAQTAARVRDVYKSKPLTLHTVDHLAVG
jgi:hypothetical protein